MGQYRLYFISRFSGHIETSREFYADEDSAAVEVASEMHNGQPMELWSRDRRLKRWEAS